MDYITHINLYLSNLICACFYRWGLLPLIGSVPKYSNIKMKKKEGFSGQRTIVLPKSIIQALEQDPITANVHVTDIGYYPNAKFHFRKRDEGIEQHILLYCISGCGWVEVDGRRSRLNENQLVVLPAGTPHQYGSDTSTPWSIYWLHFKGEQAQLYAQRLGVPVSLEPSSTSRNEERIGLFESIYSTLEMGYGVDNLCYASICLQYFLGSILFKDRYANRNDGASPAADTVSQCIHFMNENIEKKLTLNDLTAFAKYSSTQLTAIFKARTGYSPIDYLILLKVQKACQYLDHTKMKITQISPKVGIEDPLYFSRIFQKKMGMSPSEYRKKDKG